MAAWRRPPGPAPRDLPDTLTCVPPWAAPMQITRSTSIRCVGSSAMASEQEPGPAAVAMMTMPAIPIGTRQRPEPVARRRDQEEGTRIGAPVPAAVMADGFLRRLCFFDRRDLGRRWRRCGGRIDAS